MVANYQTRRLATANRCWTWARPLDLGYGRRVHLESDWLYIMLGLE